MMQNQNALAMSFPVLEKIKTVLKKDRKRSGLIVGFAVTLLILWARMLMNGPAPATASLARQSESAIMNPPETTPRLQASAAVLEWLAKPKQPVSRNLFTMHLENYARAGDHMAATSADTDLTDNPDDQTDEKCEGQILLENLRSQASTLKLQTTLMGSSPIAMINGDLLKVGDRVGGFVVTRIEANRVEIQQDGVVLEIVMP
jgi:hypothetical protein